MNKAFLFASKRPDMDPGPDPNVLGLFIAFTIILAGIVALAFVKG